MQKLTIEYYPDDITVKTDKRGDGFYEITVSGPSQKVNGGRAIAAIISRQCVGGKWCVYEFGKHGVTRFATKSAALSAAIEISKASSTAEVEAA